ncbi:MAG TPA: histidine kinase [Promicromonospora sp.]|nr:histidine kinase [Promicromonospora sp.]
MSETQATSDPTGPVPDDVEVRAVVDPATVRRAPRYRAFFWTGAIVGLVLGLVLSLYLVGSPSGASLMKPGVYVTVLTAGVTLGTTLIALLVAVIADRRSLRHRSPRA